MILRHLYQPDTVIRALARLVDAVRRHARVSAS